MNQPALLAWRLITCINFSLVLFIFSFLCFLILHT